ncbi:MAG: zf-HC2 domain-containing protein [Gemmatimonadaceae bacterium]
MQQLWDFLDRELTDEQMAAVRHHVESCSDCFPHRAWAERFLEALHSLRDEKVMPAELKARVIEKLRTAGFAGTS